MRQPPSTSADYNYGQGYWLVGSDGGIYNYGIANFYGSMGGQKLNAPMVGMSATADGLGYWEVGSDGGIFNYGDASFYGSMGGQQLNKPIVGLASTEDAKGYWEVGGDGGIFNFGDAGYYGSMGGQQLNAPIVGIAATPDGLGYWEVGSDGGIYSFGDATFYGSMGGQHLNAPIVGIAGTPDGHGYWEVGADGGIFNFGDATLYGSTGDTGLPTPMVGIAPSPSGQGYWFSGSDGGVVAYGDAQHLGAVLNSATLGGPIVGIASEVNRNPRSSTAFLTRDLATNGGFNNGLTGWSVEAHTNAVTYGSGQIQGENPYEGTGFEAMNSTSSGGIIQDITISIAVGITYCVSAELSSQGTSSNATGALALFMLGGTQEGSSINYGPLPGSNTWTRVQTCVMATVAHTELQIQFYLGAGTTTADVVNIVRDLTSNGGFNNGLTNWQVEANTNAVTYGAGPIHGENPYEGTGFEAMNSSVGGGIYQELPVTIDTGDTYCVSAELSSQGTSSGATGVLAMFLLGGPTEEGSSITYGPLPGSNQWTAIQTCVTATEPQTELLTQFFLGAGTTTVDAVDLTRDLVTNGGFNIGYGIQGWSTIGSTNAIVYGTGQVPGENPYEGSGYVAMNSTNNGGIIQQIPITINAGDTYCLSAEVSSEGNSANAAGTLTLFMLGGSGQEGSSKSYGPLPGGGTWTPIQTCVTASEAHTELQIQFYASTGTTTADAVEVG